jgi:hypothetical protein
MSARSERTRPIHLLLGGWVAANGVLTGILFIYHPQPISVALYGAALVIVSAFGLAVLAAARQGRVGAQRRIAVRGTSAVLAAVGLLLVGLGTLYGWVLSLVGLVPLIAAAATVRGERLRAGARPWPVVPDGTPPAAELPERSGTAVPSPRDYSAREARAARPVGAVKAAGLAVVAARTVRTLLRRRSGRE